MWNTQEAISSIEKFYGLDVTVFPLFFLEFKNVDHPK